MTEADLIERERLAQVIAAGFFGRFEVAEEAPCSCGMRRFTVTDHADGSLVKAHVGLLDPYNLAHRAVRMVLTAERRLTPEPHDLSTREDER